jgi:hypothetical protein
MDSNATERMYTWRGNRYTAKQLGEVAAVEKAKLTNPIERIAFDNEWVGGLPLGLYIMAVEGDHA